jgi:hypothetical protein
MADTIARLFDRPADALGAVRRLEALGIDHDDISLVANNREGWYGDDGVRHDRLASDGKHRKGDERGMKDDVPDRDDDPLEGAGDGAMTGGVLGAGAGLLAGLGMLAVPGLGPIVAAGWLAATATGAAAGAVTGGVIGGILGALTHEGVDRKDAEVYAESIKRGGAVVVVRNHGDRKREIEQALSDYSTDATARGDYYRSGGWAGYDESGEDMWDESRIVADREAARAYRPATRM